MNGSQLRMELSRDGLVSVLALTGRIDSTSANDLEAWLNKLFASGETAVLIDFAAVQYLTSAGFRVLLVATDEAARRAARIALCGIAGIVRELFDISGLADAFAIHNSRAEGVAQLS
jgi:anti-anti-sigma factor